MTPRTTVTLRGMRFHVRVGILPHERELPQPLEVDASVRVAPGTLLDYRRLYALVDGVCAGTPLDYLETIAGAMLDAMLAEPGVIGGRVAVRKPHVALPGPLAGAEIVLEQGERCAGAGDG